MERIKEREREREDRNKQKDEEYSIVIIALTLNSFFSSMSMRNDFEIGSEW